MEKYDKNQSGPQTGPLAPDNAAMPKEGGDGPVARRRALLRAAAASAPLLAGLAPNTALAQSSAFRAAEQDARVAPAAAVDTHDGWMRFSASYGKVTASQEANSATKAAHVFQIDGMLYEVDAPFDVRTKGEVLTLGGNETFQPAGNKLVLVLFGSDGSGSYQEIGKWPQYAYPDSVGLLSPAQGLHCSSWTSFAGSGTAPYQCGA